MPKSKLLRSKKGFQLQDVPQLGVLLLIIAVVLGIGATIIGSLQESSQCAVNYGPQSGGCFTCATGTTFNGTDELCYNSTGQSNATAKTSTRTLAFNATAEGSTAIKTLADWQDTWAVIIAAAVVIGIISAYLFFRKR